VYRRIRGDIETFQQKIQAKSKGLKDKFRATLRKNSMSRSKMSASSFGSNLSSDSDGEGIPDSDEDESELELDQNEK
jgi:hypothetical protein